MDIMLLANIGDCDGDLELAIIKNINLINHLAQENTSKKWQHSNTVYHALSGIDNPLIRSIVAFAVAGQLYEVSARTVKLLKENSAYFATGQKIYGIKECTAEKQENIRLYVAQKTEILIEKFENNQGKDHDGSIANSIAFVKEFKKLGESPTSLKDIRIVNDSAENDKKKIDDILEIVNQMDRLRNNDSNTESDNG